MDGPINILVLEDVEADFRLLQRHLRRKDFDTNCVLVDSLAHLVPQLDLPWDVVLSDYTMPGMDFLDMLRLLRQRWPEIPVILVSGSVGEERAVDLLHQGVTDFVLKDNLTRLGPAIQRAISETTERQARRQAEQALRDAEAVTQEAQRRHTEALQAAVDRLTEINTELERLTVVAAHDLREPLRGIISFAQMLEKRCQSKLDAAELEYVRFVVDGACRMNEMIGGLLKYSHVTATAEDIHVFSAATALDMALENIAPMARECGAIISASPLPQVKAMEVLLVQVFQNLLVNSLKFRHPDRPPRIEITVNAAGDYWRFSVADNGIGFDPAEQDVFELFRQLAPHQYRRGVGTGLAICKRILRKLSGDIWVQSQPGQGSTFSFTIPAG